MIESPYFSLIVPVYNVNLYLEQCLDSILNQSFSSYELILVNDGSTDNSLEICNKYALKNSNIKVLNQENKGLSAARNSGFRHARGSYIWFIDSDDYIKENSLNIVFQQLSKNQLDVLGFSNYHYFEDTQILKENNLNPDSPVLSNIDFLKNNYVFEIAPWIYIFNAEFLKRNNIIFREDIKIHEDGFFLIEVLCKLDTIQCIDDRLYIYRFRQNSLMRSNRLTDQIYTSVQYIYELLQLKERYLFPEFWNEQLYVELLRFYRLGFALGKSKDTYLNKKEEKFIRGIKLKANKTDVLGIKLMKLLHNHCFPLFKLKLRLNQ